MTEEEISDFLKDKVAKWWLPDEVRFIDEVPKTSVGKFDKKVLRASAVPDQGECGARRQEVMAREHTIPRETFHYKWDNSLPPAVEIGAGDVVHFDTEEVTSGQLKQGDPALEARRARLRQASTRWVVRSS